MINTIRVGKKTLSNKPRPSYPGWIDKYLLKLGGRNRFGRPYLRLAWGQEERIYWCGEMRMKYLAASAVLKTGNSFNKITQLIEPVFVRVDIGRERFFLEEWWPPELLKKGWDSEERGVFPQQGLWRSVFTIETPDCKFRLPDKDCMEWVAETWKARQESRLTFDPNEEEPAILKEWALRRTKGEIDEAFEKRKERIEDRMKASIMPHAHRMIN